MVLARNAAAGWGLYIPLLPRRRKLHIPRFAASGKAHSFRCSSFPHKISDFAGSPVGQSDFASQKSCICVTLMSQNPPVLLPRKSVCRHTLPCCRARRQPLFRVSRKQRYNTLDFAKQNRVPTGRLAPLLETPRQRDVPFAIPHFPRGCIYKLPKCSLQCLLRKCKRQSVPMRSGLPFCRQSQFYHRARNDKIKIDDDAIHGYTVIASLNGI